MPEQIYFFIYVLQKLQNVFSFGHSHVPTPMEESRHLILKQFIPPIEFTSFILSLSSFFILNTFTMWNHLESNWLNIENQIRRLATMVSKINQPTI